MQGLQPKSKEGIRRIKEICAQSGLVDSEQRQQQKQGQKAGVKTTGELERRAGLSQGTGTKQSVDPGKLKVERRDSGVSVDPEVREAQKQVVGELGEVLAKRRQRWSRANRCRPSANVRASPGWARSRMDRARTSGRARASALRAFDAAGSQP